MKDSNSINQLYDALVELVSLEPIENINVSQITKQAKVSRSTFYRNFYDKYALINCYYNTILTKTLYRYDKDLSWKEAEAAIYAEISHNLPFYQNALKSKATNSLKAHIFRISRDFHFSILKKNGVCLTDWKNVKTMEAHIYGNLEIMCDWINSGMKEPISEMIDLQNSLIPPQFVSYFINN